MDKVKTAVIMAGGFGTRLASITGHLPKAMANIHETRDLYEGQAKDTILEHQMKMLSENGITDFILVVGNKSEYIENAFTEEIINQNIPGRDIKIRYFKEETPLGTAGAFCSKELQEMIGADPFLFTYSDVLFDVNLQDMAKKHFDEKADATVLISPCAQPDDRPICVKKDGSDEVIRLIPKQQKGAGPREVDFPNTPKNGLMILSTSFFKTLPEEPRFLDMEESVLSTLIYDKDFKVAAWDTPCYVKDIGTVDRFKEGVDDLKHGIPELKNPAKHSQPCVVFSEMDLFRDTEGRVTVNDQVALSIRKLNNSGIITILSKDHLGMEGMKTEDMIVDTRLVRDGEGAFINGRFEHRSEEPCEFGDFADIAQRWNISPTEAYFVKQHEDSQMCTVGNFGLGETFEAQNLIGASYYIEEMLSKIMEHSKQQNESESNAVEENPINAEQDAALSVEPKIEPKIEPAPELDQQ